MNKGILCKITATKPDDDHGIIINWYVSCSSCSENTNLIRKKMHEISWRWTQLLIFASSAHCLCFPRHFYSEYIECPSGMNQNIHWSHHRKTNKKNLQLWREMMGSRSEAGIAFCYCDHYNYYYDKGFDLDTFSNNVIIHHSIAQFFVCFCIRLSSNTIIE